MIRGRNILLTLLIIFISLLPYMSTTQAQTPVVQAVLFYSTSCPHCKQVIDEVLPVLDRQYGTQLQIYGVNTNTEEGTVLYNNYVEVYEVPPEMQGVPALVVGDQYLVGSKDIPDNFPGVIEDGLASGGIDWPDIPGLIEAMQTEETEANSGSSPVVSEVHRVTLREKFAADLAGNILSVIVLTGMLASVTYAGINFSKQTQPKKDLPAWLIPLVSLIGLGIAGYLAYVEFNQVEAVCGPVGNCNTVQQSSYATLFGFLPVGVLGVLGYIAILITWLLGQLDLPEYQHLFKLSLWVITLFGVLFSIYLTFLEPFVIGASCMWCLSSAVIMTILFLAASRQLNSQEPDVEE